MTRPLLYLAHPIRRRTLADAARLTQAIARALELGWMPVAGWLLLRDHLNDANEDERAIAIACDLSLLAACNAFLVVGERVTEGMRHELDAWRSMNNHGRCDACSPRVAAWWEPEPFCLETLRRAPGGAA